MASPSDTEKITPTRKSFLLRLTPELLEEVRGWADRGNIPMNLWVTNAIRAYIHNGIPSDEKTSNQKWWEKDRDSSVHSPSGR